MRACAYAYALHGYGVIPRAYSASICAYAHALDDACIYSANNIIAYTSA